MLLNRRSIPAQQGPQGPQGLTGATGAIGPAGPQDPWEVYAAPNRTVTYCTDEYLHGATSAASMLPCGTISVSGTGAVIAPQTGDLAHPGVLTFSTGTAPTGRAGQLGYAAAIRFGGGSWVYEAAIRLTTLSDVTNTYSIWAGFGDRVTAEPTDGTYFRYTHSVNSGKFECVTSNNATRTAVDTGVTVAAATWYRLRHVRFSTVGRGLTTENLAEKLDCAEIQLLNKAIRLLTTLHL